MKGKHQELFAKFTATFKPETVSKWETMVKVWEIDNRKPNPYAEPINSMYYILPISLFYLTFSNSNYGAGYPTTVT